MDNQFVDPTTGVGKGGPAPFLMDVVTGAQLVMNRAADASVDSVRALVAEPSPDGFVLVTNVNADVLAYVASLAIDLADYNFISVLPRVTTAAGGGATKVYWKFQWSTDGVNWMEDWMPETWSTAGTPASGERQAALADVYNTRQFVIAAGYKGNLGGATALGVAKRARYVRIAQKVDVQITSGSEVVEYHYQLLA